MRILVDFKQFKLLLTKEDKFLSFFIKVLLNFKATNGVVASIIIKIRNGFLIIKIKK